MAVSEGEKEIRTIWQLSDELDEYKNLKNECMSKVLYFDVVENNNTIHGFCSERDEQIKLLKSKIKELTTKQYEIVLGL
jgi:hypothetical protein